jgi:ABC-2 type transport system permease protein
MKKSQYYQMARASFIMLWRDPHNIFWTLLLPLVLTVMFLLYNPTRVTNISVGISAASSKRQLVSRLEHRLRQEGVGEIRIVNRRVGLSDLAKGNIDLLVLIQNSANNLRSLSLVEPRPVTANTRLAQAAIEAAIDVNVPKVEKFYVVSRVTNYADFLIPGMIGVAIMDAGLFTVLYSFVHLKRLGVLRRLAATPMKPSSFLFGQAFARVFLAVVQACLLIAVGLLFFGLHLVGNIGLVLLLTALGATLFILFGYGVSGFIGNVETAAPIANGIGLPMIFLSGVFFSRSVMPGWLQFLTGLLPLTYVTEGIRSVVAYGAGLSSVLPDILGMVVWSCIFSIASVRFFRRDLA